MFINLLKMVEDLERRYERMMEENPRQVLSVTFRVERRKYNRCRFVVDSSKWNVVNPLSYSGRDVRCFLCTLFAEYACSRKLIRKERNRSVFSCETREFILMRERCKGQDKKSFLFHTKEVIIGSSPLEVREPFFIGEIVPKISSQDKIVLFKNLEHFLKEFIEPSIEHQTKCLSTTLDYRVCRSPSMNEARWLNSNCINPCPEELFEPRSFVYPKEDRWFPIHKHLKPIIRVPEEFKERKKLFNSIRRLDIQDELDDHW